MNLLQTGGCFILLQRGCGRNQIAGLPTFLHHFKICPNTPPEIITPKNPKSHGARLSDCPIQCCHTCTPQQSSYLAPFRVVSQSSISLTYCNIDTTESQHACQCPLQHDLRIITQWQSYLLLLFDEHPKSSVVDNKVITVHPLVNEVCVCVCVCVCVLVVA